MEELIKFWQKGSEKNFFAYLDNLVSNKGTDALEILLRIIKEEKHNGLIIRGAVKAYFRIKRIDNSDCTPLFEMFELFSFESTNIVESLLTVLGYDKMIPNIDDQKKIIQLFFNFGDGFDLKYTTDPRYGLAAACAGWDFDVVEQFLRYCLTIEDKPLKYVAKNSLNRKYIKLRS